MSIFKRNQISPFDQYYADQDLDIEISGVNPSDKYLSLRASVFMIGLILTLSMIVVNGESLLALITVVLASVFISFVAGLFLRRPLYRPLVLFLNTVSMLGIIVILSIITNKITVGDYILFIPLVAGVTSLGVEPNDYRKVYRKPDLMYEMVMPVLGALVSVALASLTLELADHYIVSLMFIMAAIYLGLFSFIVSKITRRHVFFSTPVISDYSNILSASSDNVKAFLVSRVKSIVAFSIALVVGLGSSYIVNEYLINKSELSLALIPLTSAVVYMIMGFAIYGKRPRSIHKILFTYEACMGTMIASTPFMAVDVWKYSSSRLVVGFIIYWLVVVAVDFLISGYLIAFKRRAIFAEPPKYFSGIPLLMIICGIVLMCIEALTL